MTFKKIILVLALVTSTLFVLHSGTVHAALFDNSTSQACAGVGLGSNGCSGGGAKLTSVIAVALNILSVLVGVAAVFMIVLGGYRYVSSGGDSGKVSSAKSTILYAVIGLVIVALAQGIVVFVLNATNATPKAKTSEVQLARVIESRSIV